MVQRWVSGFEGQYDDGDTVLEIDLLGRGEYQKVIEIIDKLHDMGFRGTQKLEPAEETDGNTNG